MEEVEDGAELPHAAEPPAGQLRGRLGLRHERRDHAALRRVVGARRRRRGAPARPLGRRRGRGLGLAVARAGQSHLPRGRLLLLRRRRRPLPRLPRRRLRSLLLLPLLRGGGRCAVAGAAGFGHGVIRSGICAGARVRVWVGAGVSGARGGGGGGHGRGAEVEEG